MTGAILTLLALWVLLGAVWAAVWPFFRAQPRETEPTELEMQDLLAEKAHLLAEIHELELDWETGKLSEEDYRALEARLKGRAIEIMQEIDAREAAGLERRSRRARRQEKRRVAG